MKLVMMIEAATTNEFKQAVADLNGLLCTGEVGTNPPRATKKKTAEKEAPAAPVVEEKEEKSVISPSAIRAEAAKAEAAQPKNDPFAEDESAASEPDKKLTFDDIKFALQNVADKVGMDKASEITESFGAKKISAIKEVDYKAFVQKCAEVLDA